jgi:hypothetical protein
VKVQCKRTVKTIGARDLQRLAGALAHGAPRSGSLCAWFVSPADAVHLERILQDLRLITGIHVVDLVFGYYENLDPVWKAVTSSSMWLRRRSRCRT